jgi:competence CoiA-like predicted nuclease
MILANKNGKLMLPEKSGEIAECPHCFGDVRSYCGEVYVKHWKHIYESNCEYSNSGESEWHSKMKNMLYEKGATIEQRIGHKIADVLLDNGFVVEFQNSPISKSECIERNKNNNNKVIWVFNCNEQYDNEQITIDGSYYEYFSPRANYWFCDILFFQIKDFFLEVKFKKYGKGFFKNYTVTTIEGYCFIKSFEEFYQSIINYK